MKTGITLFRLLFICIVCLACSSGGKKINPEFRPKAGVIHADYRLKSDSSFSCALYIPKSIPDSVIPACIIFFDPHGDGLLPVKNYQDLADQFGWIMIGSNQIRNGMNPEQIDLIVSLLFNEAGRVLRADSSRMYLGGFSGGARVATLSAFYKVKAKGIIACGAGLTGAGATPVNRADYFGLAGSADFNMNEIVTLDYPLTQAGIRHSLMTFSGIHEWPTIPVMKEAFSWHTINAMKDRSIKPDTVFVNLFIKQMILKTTRLYHSGRFLEAEMTGKRTLEYGKDLITLNYIQGLTNEIRKNPVWERQQDFLSKVLQDEEETRRKLMEYMTQKDTLWWKQYLIRLSGNEKQRLAELPDDSTFLTSTHWEQKQDGLMKQRLLAFLRLLFYMNANAALTSPNPEATRKIITLYKLADPDNPEPYYMEAIYYARIGKTTEALGFLDVAIKKGFSEMGRMNDQAEFAALKNSAVFYDLLKKTGHDK